MDNTEIGHYRIKIKKVYFKIQINIFKFAVSTIQLLVCPPLLIIYHLHGLDC